MPGFLSSMAAAATNEKYAYVLPDTVDYDAAPSHLDIEGYARLKLERTREAFKNPKERYKVEDTLERTPMFLGARNANLHPAVLTQQPKPSWDCILMAAAGASALLAGLIGVGVLLAPTNAALCGVMITLGALGLVMGLALYAIDRAPKLSRVAEQLHRAQA